MKFKLKQKLSLVILGVIVFFGLIAVIGIFVYSKNFIFNLQKNSLEKIAIHDSSLVYQNFSNILNISKILSQDEDIVEYLNKGDKTFQDDYILGHLGMYNIDNTFDVLYLMDSNGTTLVSTDETFVNKNYSFRDYFKGTLSGESVVDVSLGVTTKKLGYYFSSPVLNENRDFLGAVVIKIKPEIIDKIFAEEKFSDEYHIMIVDKFGVIIHSDISDRLYKSIGRLSNIEKNEIAASRRYEGLDIVSLDYEEAKIYINRIVGAETIYLYDEMDEEEEVLSIAKINQFPFYIILEEETSKYYSLVKDIVAILSFIIIFTALFSALIIFVFVKNFIKPLVDLRGAAERVAKGDLSVRLAINSSDELEDIAAAFNKMVSKMEKNVKNIETEVYKRTEKLEKINSYMVGRELKMIELKNKLKNKKK